MDKFKLETSIQFPFFKMNEVVTFSEVKKPSGVAYILLVLISESKDKRANLSQTLENFGVPRNLHYIFADTIQYLFDQNILVNNPYFNKNEFDRYQIGDFAFTSDGVKIFAAESIPTGAHKESKIPVFYDIAKNELSLKMDADLDPKPLMDCAISPEFMEQFKCKKDVEGFLNLQKGKGISIKKEEIITQVDLIENAENWVGKYDCVMTIDGDEVDVKFEDMVLQRFVETYYTQEMINKIISYKNKFQFKSAFAEHLRIGSYSDKLVEILIPKDIEDVLKQKNQMLLTKGNYKSNSGLVISSPESLKVFDDTVEFIQIDMHDAVYAFVPAVFDFKNKTFGTIELPLVLKLKLSQDELKKIVMPYITSISGYSEENYKALVAITGITKDIETAYNVMRNYLSNDVESNIVLLNEIKQTALSNSGILAKYKELLQDNYFKYLESINEDNLDSVLKITNSIPKFLNIQAKDVLARIFSGLRVNNPLSVYESLVGGGFDKSVVVLYANPVEQALSQKSANEKTVLDLLNFDDNLSNLKKIVGVEDYKKYTIDEEEINHQDFKSVYDSAYNLYKNIQVFKPCNESLFVSYNGFMQLFGRISDDINIIDAALKNPNNIKPELINKKIATGDYQFVFVNLSAKLEIILKTQYGLDGKLSDMLSEARRAGLIDRNIISDLHDFRENRNANIHPEDRTANYKADDLRRWSKEIFDLEVKDK